MLVKKIKNKKKKIAGNRTTTNYPWLTSRRLVEHRSSHAEYFNRYIFVGSLRVKCVLIDVFVLDGLL